MPYTPPSQRSPASSTAGSPVLSRNHSYAANGDQSLAGLSSQSSQRPALPRSMSSTAYLQKHRRSPSMTDHKVDHLAVKQATSAANGARHNLVQHIHSLMSVQGDGNNSSSSPGSSDEDRGRKVDAMSLQQLEAALAKIESPSFRGHSPTREGEAPLVMPAAAAEVRLPSPAAAVSSSPGLTPTARKISHSRSSSETHLPVSKVQISTSNLHPSTHSSSDDSDVEDEDDELRIKPPLLRKKSGELVKPALRPSSRRRPSSMPGTPTYSKAVHFDTEIEQVRHFLQVDRPIAVSAGSSPVETYDSESDFPWAASDGYASKKAAAVEWDIKVSNFPADTFERQSKPVRVERIFLSADNKSLVGTVACQNLAFHKSVVARFTLDYWKTTSEVVAEYNNDVRKKQSNDGCDRFNFNIKLADQAHLETKTLLLCVRYNVAGTEYWDNNANMNYQVDFQKKKTTKPKAHAAGPGMQTTSGSLGSIPRSRHTPPTAGAGRNARTQPASPDDDFVSRFDSSGYRFGGPKKLVIPEPPQNTIKFRNHRAPRKGSVFPEEARTSTAAAAANNGAGGQVLGFSTRYDFSASLTAALNNAQSALGSRSGLMPRSQPPPPSAASFNTDAAPPPTQQPAALAVKPVDAARPTGAPATEARPGLQSAEYNDLIAKYCFFGSAAGSKTSSPPSATPEDAPPKPRADDAADDGGFASHSSSVTSSAVSSQQSSGSNSPTPPAVSHIYDGTSESRNHSRTPSAYGSTRSNSPHVLSLRSGSPVPFENQQGFGAHSYGMFEAAAQVMTHG